MKYIYTFKKYTTRFTILSYFRLFYCFFKFCLFKENDFIFYFVNFMTKMEEKMFCYISKIVGDELLCTQILWIDSSGFAKIGDKKCKFLKL